MQDENPRSTPTRSPDSEAERRASPDTEQLAAQMSALLADLVRTPQADLDDWAHSLEVGDRLGRFTLVRELGRGGMGVVWEAEDPDLSRRVALKVVKPGANARQRGADWLRREAEAVARLSHPNIVTLFDFGLAESGPYLVFELLRGQPLDKRLRHGPLPFDSVLAIAIETTRALVHAHRAGVVHRDLKPANVYVSDSGDVKVLDFGLATLLGRTGPLEGGTPAFMAPEQWRGELGDERTDLFALGVTLWSALTGGVPYPVKDGRSAVEAPGATPRLPAACAPARFRRLVERCLERDPSDRPDSSKVVLDALRALQADLAGRSRRRLVAGLVAAVIAAAGVALWSWWLVPPPAGERLTTVVADAENQTGEPALDGLDRLLTTSLEPSQRLALVPRARLLAMAREARLGDQGRLDARTARELARLASAQVLLLTSARREGAGVVVELKGLDPATDRPLFTLSESARGAAETTAVLERLSEAARRKLRERGEDLKAGRLSLAAAVSPNLEAAGLYYQGVDCEARPSRRATHVIDACGPLFERALALDPAFALAHFRLAVLLAPRGGAQAGARAHLEAALRAVDRLPPREAELVRAWADHLEGRDEAALRRLDGSLSRFPDDREALELSATIRLGQGDHAGAVPFWERLLQLDPGDEAAHQDLVFSLAMLDRRDELRRVAERLEAQPPTLGLTRAAARARIWLGEGPAAVALARRAVERDGGPAARFLLGDMLLATAAYGEVEPILRAGVEAAPAALLSHYRLALALAGQGRLRAALDALDEGTRRAKVPSPVEPVYVRAALLAGSADAPARWRAATTAHALDAGHAADLAVLLLLKGDAPHAAELAAGLREGTAAAAQYQALLAWRRGDAAGAAARLTAAEAANRWPTEGLAPAFLLAEVSAAAGLPRETLDAVERYRRLMPLGYWSSWARLRTMLLAGRAHLALGDLAAARREADQLLSLLRRADADLPLLAEARALRARL